MAHIATELHNCSYPTENAMLNSQPEIILINTANAYIDLLNYSTENFYCRVFTPRTFKPAGSTG